MKRLFYTSLFALMTVDAHASEVPVFVKRDVPDYTATMVVHNRYRESQNGTRTVDHHGGWTRVEEAHDGVTYAWYGQFFNNVLVTTVEAQGEIVRISVSKSEPLREYHSIREIRQTDETEEVGGEQCRWYQVFRRPPDEKYNPVWRHCLTSDGIEIAAEVSSNGTLSSEARLIQLQREPVKREQVTPPGNLFKSSYWLRQLRAYDTDPAVVDYDVALAGFQSEARMLRHYPWHMKRRHGEDGSIRFVVWNELEDQGISYYSYNGLQSLEAVRSPVREPDSLGKFQEVTGSVSLGKSEQYLGERCNWYDLMPNVADRGLTRCLTPDGIPLKDISKSWGGGGSTLEATSFSRRPVDMRELEPPVEFLDPATWDYPNLK